MQDFIQTFFELVKIDSETGNEKPVVDYLIPRLSDMGFSITIDNANQSYTPSNTGNIIARRGDTTADDAILLSAHMDTVKPGVGIEPIIKDGIIVSKGNTILGSDDKAGITAMLEGVKLADNKGIKTKPLELIFCIAEEGGLNGSKYLDYSKINAKRGFVLDSSGIPGDIIHTAPAQDQMVFTVKGKAAHAGVAPEKGISAIVVAAEAIANMKLLRIDSETTANVSQIKGGGATNIVTDQVVVSAEARSRSGDKLKLQTNHMIQCFEDACKKYGATLSSEVHREYDAYTIAEDSDIINLLKSAMQRIGISPNIKASGGGSDANNYNQNGVNTVNLGVGMTNVHTTDESIKVEHLEQMVNLVAELIKA